jgi:hypothetical protein
MHHDFMLAYQKPIMEQFGLSAYGCCEDLTCKIDILRQVRNLRRIAVTPRANVVKCAQQIGRDYVLSWRPNPTDMVCGNFDVPKIRATLHHGLTAIREHHCPADVTLKDVETVEGDLTRLPRWFAIVREEIAKVYG